MATYQSTFTGQQIDNKLANCVLQSDLLNLIYPVGSIYLSVNATNPSTLFGGTWERIQDKFILAAGSTYEAGTTGGSAAHTHTLSHTHAGQGTLAAAVGASNNEVASISYLASSIPEGAPTTVEQYTLRIYSTVTTQRNFNHYTPVYGNTSEASNTTTSSSGTLPPYLSVYVWKRTA